MSGEFGHPDASRFVERTDGAGRVPSLGRTPAEEQPAVSTTPGTPDHELVDRFTAAFAEVVEGDAPAALVVRRGDREKETSMFFRDEFVYIH